MNMLRDMLQPTRRNMLRSMFTSTSALTRFGVNGVEAALALDFIASEYRTANTATTFADAFMGNSPRLTYNPGSASTSQSTMTQGYGPELVTNGDFATDTDWTLNGSASISASISGGVANLTATNDAVKQDLTGTQGTTVEVSFTANRTSGTNLRVYVGGSLLSDVSTPTGTYTYILEGGNTDNEFQIRSNGFVGTISNISVREAPKIVWAPHNLVEYSEDFSQWGAGSTGTGVTPVVTPNAGTAPDGSLGADRVQLDLGGGATASDSAQLNVIPAYGGTGVAYTLSVWMKSYDGNSYDVMLDFNGAAVQVETITNQWRLVSVTMAALDTVARPVNVARLRGAAGTSSTADILIYGAHVYRSDLGGMAPVPGAVGDFQYYVPTNGAAEYLPRVGHHVFNGSTWVNEGLLIESEQRANLITYSEDFASVWAKTTSAATPTVTSTGPDGTTSATKLGDSGAGGSGQPYISYGVTVATSTTYTYSVFAKAGDLSDILLYVGGFTSPANNGYYFDLANGTYSAYTGTPPITPLMEDFGNGWYRCSITFTTDAVDTSGNLQIYVADGTNLTLPLDNTSNVLIYGAQFEQGEAIPNTNPVQYKDAPTPSSYIPTNGSTVTRGGQSLTVPPAQFGWDSSAVSIQMDGRMTYADEDAFATVLPWRWFFDSSNNLYTTVDTDGAETGELNFRYDGLTSPTDAYTPGVLVPFNISSRHGSTFVRGAADGVLANLGPTPTALPDLSNTDLQIAKDFMGTIGQFRQFAGDVGDAGLVTATNPSTEPTLSLTFDGTEGSFYNLSWSE